MMDGDRRIRHPVILAKTRCLVVGSSVARKAGKRGGGRRGAKRRRLDRSQGLTQVRGQEIHCFPPIYTLPLVVSAGVLALVANVPRPSKNPALQKNERPAMERKVGPAGLETCAMGAPG